jgi:hypothetical protein
MFVFPNGAIVVTHEQRDGIGDRPSAAIALVLERRLSTARERRRRREA